MSDRPSFSYGVAKAMVAKAWTDGYNDGFRRGLVLGVISGFALALLAYELFPLVSR